MDKLYLGIDLGGTNIAAGLVDSSGEIIARRNIPTPTGSDNIVDALETLCRQLMTDDVSSIGIGVPGTVWPRGTVSYACNVGMKNVPLADILSPRLQKPVYIENDANCAALGEYHAGCGRGKSSLLCVTLGTGVGGGYVENGRLFRGFNGCGAELGHMVIDPSGEKCACGRKGCFETFASTSALINRMNAYISSNPHSPAAQIAAQSGVDGRTLFAAMDAGDLGAEEIYREHIRYITLGLTNLANIFQPEILCIGGGISAQGEKLLAPIREILEAEEYARDCENRTTLRAASLGNDAGLIGAALLERTENND